MFSDARFGLVRVSVENFTLIIGASELLLAAKAFEVSKLASDGQPSSASATSLDKAVSIINEYVDGSKLGTFQTMNAYLELCQLQGISPEQDRLDQYIHQLGGESPLCFFDQVANVIKLLEHHDLFGIMNLDSLKHTTNGDRKVRGERAISIFLNFYGVP